MSSSLLRKASPRVASPASAALARRPETKSFPRIWHSLQSQRTRETTRGDAVVVVVVLVVLLVVVVVVVMVVVMVVVVE